MSLSKEIQGLSLSKDSLDLLNAMKKSSVSLGTSASGSFNYVIVYLRRHELSDGTDTGFKGMFRYFSMSDIIVDKPLNDFTLDEEMFVNRHGTTVRPVSVKVKGVYLRASLFARVRVGAQIVWVRAIIRSLNHQLEKYDDDKRNAIAMEWCAQEHYRIFPAKPWKMYPEQFAPENKEILRQVMKELLPKGFDDEYPM